MHVEEQIDLGYVIVDKEGFVYCDPAWLPSYEFSTDVCYVTLVKQEAVNKKLLVFGTDSRYTVRLFSLAISTAVE